MKVLIIGYGSIGKRHEKVLLEIDYINSIDIVTKQKLEKKQTFNNLKDVKNISSYDYYIISSETSKHYDQLLFLENKLENKIIFCEKPLFNSKKDLTIKNNTVLVGYNLRFHPLLIKLNELLKNERILFSNIVCGQYLPTWRVNTNYKNSYSAKKELGGGVLLDLSHEIDYIHHLFGKLSDIKSFQVKISDLDINSDDLTTFIAKSNKDIYVNLTIDYISKITQRRMFIHTIENTYELDFINNTLIKKNKNGISQDYSSKSLERNNIIKSMHNSIIKNKGIACTYKEAQEVMNTILIIQEQNNV